MGWRGRIPELGEQGEVGADSGFGADSEGDQGDALADFVGQLAVGAMPLNGFDVVALGDIFALALDLMLD